MTKELEPKSGDAVHKFTFLRDVTSPQYFDNRIAWELLCQCGKVVIKRKAMLFHKTHPTKSCGCHRSKVSSETNRTHGKSNTKEYKIWSWMKSRCENPNDTAYYNYGKRGIKVCERWSASFENFFEDMGVCPEKMTIERLDVDGDYCKSNCYWADCFTQSYNKRKSPLNTSGKTGVSFDKNLGAWRASITRRKVRENSPLYKDKQSAIAWRINKELEYFGKTKE